MSALAATRHPADVEPDQDIVNWGSMRLSSLLAATADRHPHRLAFVDPVNRKAWSGRPKLNWSFQVAHAFSRRLSAFLSSLNLPRGATVGVCLPGGSEACLTLLAIEQAGFTACLLSLSWPEDELAQAVEAANVQVVITQSMVGDLRPAEVLCRLAARYFALRFVAAFGPHVPDGVIDLDRCILETGAAPETGTPDESIETGLVTFVRRDGALTPVFRSCQAAVAAAVTFLVSAEINPGDRIVTLLAPDDHRGLTTGLLTALLSGATLESHGLFDGATFLDALGGETPVHVVAPGWLEPTLAAAGLRDAPASTILVHDAPVRFKARTALKRNVVDVLAFGETALIARPRDERGQFALSLDEDALQSSITTRNLLRVRRDPDGSIAFAGLAAQVRAYDRGGPAPARPAGEWTGSIFRADVFAGIVIGVS